jgi:hypothetical protein
MATETDCAMKSGKPILPPTSTPNDWEMMAKAPPAPTRVLVATEETERPVVMVMMWASRIIPIAPPSPALPTTCPWRRYMMTPRMVRMVGV